MKAKETSPLYQAIKSKKRKYTYQDYLQLPDDRNRYEIINGELIATPAPLLIHQKILGFLFKKLSNFVESKHLGNVFIAPCDVIFDETHIVQPDILFISKSRQNLLTEENIQGAPDLIIEILSPATAYYDLFDKKETYQKFGVQEYWIVDLKREWIEFYALEKGIFKLQQREEKVGEVHSILLPEFKIGLKDLFREVEAD